MLFSHILYRKIVGTWWLVYLYYLKAVGQGQVYRNFEPPGNIKLPPTYTACLMPTAFFFSYK